MSFEDELLGEFVVEAKEHLAGIENQFLAIEASGDDVDVALVNEVFRAVHSIKGAAGFLGMTKVNDLSHSLENVLNKMRNLELKPSSAIVEVMLRSADKLEGMIDDIHNSNKVDVSELVTALEAVARGEAATSAATAAAASNKPAAASSSSASATAAEVPSTAAPTKPAVAAPAADRAPAAPVPTAAAKENNIRVSVGLLDKLMNQAGELVLSRNQLLQALSSDGQANLEAIAARLDQVTSELQDSIMQTRMQQIGNVFGRFTRVVRDLSAKLGKDCDLYIEGKEVEVDKTIVEAIGDPLTHLVRNSIDHGVEMPEVRVKAGKSPRGRMNIRAFHQAGKVCIEIEDDGAGIDPRKLREKAVAKGVLTAEQAEQMSDRESLRLIFHPGFSTAAKVTEVSGRGVGMDVVRTNIAKLGGTVDVESVVGAGTTVVITLPLTLAIIPSLIVQSGVQRFAIPQVNISELVRVRPQEMTRRLGRVKDAEVLRLRGSLLPLVRLGAALGFEGERPSQQDAAAVNIIVVESGQQRFGLVVDASHDSEEIVVKPLGRHLQNSPCLSGATILGDGHVAMILDVAALAAHQQIGSSAEADDNHETAHAAAAGEDAQSVLIFTNHPQEQFAVCMDVVARIERIRVDQIDSVGGQELVQYRHASLPLLRLENLVAAREPEPASRLFVIVFEVAGKEVGLVAPRLEDIRDASTEVDTVTFRERGVLGSLVISQRTTRLVDLFELAEAAHPEWFADEVKPSDNAGLPTTVLLAEDSTFFRNQVKSVMVERGYRVVDCEDGQAAWDQLEGGLVVPDLVVTDIEMPNMNGFELCQRIKESPRWQSLPVIALTSLAGAADIERGLQAGIDDYQIKMDRDKLLAALRNFAGAKTVGASRLQPV